MDVTETEAPEVRWRAALRRIREDLVVDRIGVKAALLRLLAIMLREERQEDPPREALEAPGLARLEQLERLMKATGGNMSAVGRALGVSRQAISQALERERGR